MSRLTGPRQSLRVVAVCHRLQPQDFVARLQALAARSGIRLQGMVVANNAAHPCPASTGELQFIQGSNELLDFSGFFEGHERLLSVWPEAAGDNLLFVNDTLFTKHAAGCILSHVLGLEGLMRELQLPAIGGKLDTYRSICLRNPWSGHGGFITTFCFLLNAAAQPALRRLRADAEADGVLVDAPPGDPAWGCGIPPAFREFIRAHVTYSASTYLWPSAPTSDAALLRRKACCVYFEGRLSGAIALEGAVLPINTGPRSRTDIFVREMAARAWRTLPGTAR
jgi:hypothetical protein